MFELYDTVEIVEARGGLGFGAPRPGTKGFIDEVFDDGRYSFQEVEMRNGKPQTSCCGTVYPRFLKKINDFDATYMRDSVLSDRQKRYDEAMKRYKQK